ncbi:MAG: hypothetical protein ACHQQS_09700 [Thermoanaerobaculales bacterium]
MPWDEVALRYAAFATGVQACAMGTASATHLWRTAEIVVKGPLPERTVAEFDAAFARTGAGWRGAGLKQPGNREKVRT